MNSAMTRTNRISVDELRVWRSFLVAYARVTRQLETDLIAEQSLLLAHYDVLVQLIEAPGYRLRMAELAERALISRSGLTRLVDRLVEDDLVRREICEYDARGLFAVLTPMGYDRLRTASSTHLRGVEEYVVARFSPQQLHQFGQLLSLLDPTSDRGVLGRDQTEVGADGGAGESVPVTDLHGQAEPGEGRDSAHRAQPSARDEPDTLANLPPT